MSPFSMDYCLRNVSYDIVAFVTQYHIFENQPLFYDKLFPFNIATQVPTLIGYRAFEKVSKKVEISGKIIGETMLAGIMNLDGWRLAIKDNEHETTLIITGEDETAITQIKNLLAKTKIDIAILTNLNVKQ